MRSLELTTAYLDSQKIELAAIFEQAHGLFGGNGACA